MLSPTSKLCEEKTNLTQFLKIVRHKNEKAIAIVNIATAVVTLKFDATHEQGPKTRRCRKVFMEINNLEWKWLVYIFSEYPANKATLLQC